MSALDAKVKLLGIHAKISWRGCDGRDSERMCPFTYKVKQQETTRHLDLLNLIDWQEYDTQQHSQLSFCEVDIVRFISAPSESERTEKRRMRSRPSRQISACKCQHQVAARLKLTSFWTMQGPSLYAKLIPLKRKQEVRGRKQFTVYPKYLSRSHKYFFLLSIVTVYAETPTTEER